MFKFLIPKKFCKDYAILKKKDAQLIFFMALVFGKKLLMDLWIDCRLLNKYQRIFRKYNIKTKFDVIFNRDKYNFSGAIGGAFLTTTKARAQPFAKISDKKSQIHIFISKSFKNLQYGFGNGWYPLIIKNRVIQKPYIDLINFGYNLGYPKCCVDFFQKFNNWSKYSHFYEVLKNTKGGPHYLCNPFARYSYYSYIAHIPCSFNCSATKNLVKEIRNQIRMIEPELINEIDSSLKAPCLVFYENRVYSFDGFINKKRLYYKKVWFLGTDEARNIYFDQLKNGDNLEIKNFIALIYRGDHLIDQIDPVKNGFPLEKPFLIKFKQNE